MPLSTPGPRALRQTAGALGALALLALGAAPASADDPATGLVLGALAPVDGVKPGAEIQVPATFTNTGGAALGKVWMSYSVTRGLSHTAIPSNCLRYEVTSFDEAPSSSDLVCAFDQQIEPGVVYAPERPATLKALDHALHDELRVSVAAYDPAPTDGAADPVRGTGPAVKLVERPDEKPAAPGSARHDGWDAADVPVTTDNTADFQVTGARLRGRVGDTVDVQLKFTNAGPGWVLRASDGPAAHVLVKMPAGTTVTKADGYCEKAGDGGYECGTSQRWVDEKRGETYAFRVRIDKAVAGAEGSVALTGESRPFDADKTNDTAAITLDVTGGSTGGSGSTGGGSASSAGGTGTTGGSGSTAGGSATGGTSGSASTGGATGGSDGGSDGGSASAASSAASSASGGNLANTGSGSVLPVAAAAAGAVVVGAGAIVVVRRRAGRQR
ncbi:hypothetical protein QR97_35910 [Streptomyces sp. PBH53]|uniref:hypothetical protein n=1 Tax=Streptomyces TaxID=1883 RepID=UPI000655A6C3|nr:hypothetical protein [Streptomyces sp. PBH53]AKN74404.1 hypothetical protein QR97_35910 [Streptomyces sp. PBH53]